jgi:hypothetical protein
MSNSGAKRLKKVHLLEHIKILVKVSTLRTFHEVKCYLISDLLQYEWYNAAVILMANKYI